ncbi:GIY-YIG nuclease family protein [Prescottella agglutinans]|uniref:GIY-YIG nuclease family protein n=1 Tax=Prescottella agglutinans TaxID=1644129 RepID=A0A3S3ATP3_9NOCA|nr:GIY-YIG nuclease family protein [Prescottella agglutinans]RVW08217.1 GIY-YIG nuclease family protein [Prescottella agglutinans]
MANEAIAPEIADYLGRYVYALVDPRGGVPFYVGKGTRDRVLHHGWAARALSVDEETTAEKAKLARINEIEAAGLEVDIWILRRGMSIAEYGHVEATVIDLLLTFAIAPLSEGSRPISLSGGTALTNRVRGGKSDSGIARLSDIVDALAAPQLTAQDPLLLITLNGWTEAEEECPGGVVRDGHGFHPAWKDKKVLEKEIVRLGNSVRCWWTLNPDNVKSKGIEHLVAVHEGVTRGLFRILEGSAETIPTVTANGAPTRRSGFRVEPVTSGSLFDRVVGPHGHRVPPKKRGDQSQFRYWPYS